MIRRPPGRKAQPEIQDRGGRVQGAGPGNRRDPGGSPIPGRAFGLPGMTSRGGGRVT